MSASVRLRRLGHGADLPLPDYKTAGAAGADIVAALDADAPLTLGFGERAAVPTGFAAEIPDGFEIQVRPRSGLAAKNGVTLVNAPGTIDCDYRGEIAVILINLGSEPFTVRRGDRIAQLVVAPVTRARFEEADVLSETGRGTDGFGSTGI